MSDDPWNSWSNDPDTPKLPRFALALGRSTFAGILVGSILYGTRTPSPTHSRTRAQSVRLFISGTLVALFFQCMAALLNPVHRRGEGIKWGLVSYTVIMFSFATVHAANLNIPSISLIDNPEFSSGPPSGPAPYKNIMVTPTVLGLTPNVVFALSNWLADGLLVSALFDVALSQSPRCLTPVLPLALSLLHNLLHEPLGNRLPLPCVPCLCGYAFDSSTSRWWCSGLTSRI